MRFLNLNSVVPSDLFVACGACRSSSSLLKMVFPCFLLLLSFHLELMLPLLSSIDPHYIRCIKPNANKVRVLSQSHQPCSWRLSQLCYLFSQLVAHFYFLGWYPCSPVGLCSVICGLTVPFTAVISFRSRVSLTPRSCCGK